jgi:hypothetical protein
LRRHHSWKPRTWSSASDVSGASSASIRRAIGVFVPRFCLGCLATSGPSPLDDRASRKKKKGPPGASRLRRTHGIPSRGGYSSDHAVAGNCSVGSRLSRVLPDTGTPSPAEVQTLLLRPAELTMAASGIKMRAA